MTILERLSGKPAPVKLVDLKEDQRQRDAEDDFSWIIPDAISSIHPDDD